MTRTARRSAAPRLLAPLAAIALAAALLASLPFPSSAQAVRDARTVNAHGIELELLGQDIFGPRTRDLGRFGGLSAVRFLPDDNRRAWAVSDDNDEPAILELDVLFAMDDRSTTGWRLKVTPRRYIRAEHPATDAEGLVLLPPRNTEMPRAIVSYERPPTVAWLTPEGPRTFNVPEQVRDHARHNRAFESLTLDAEGRLWAATEAAIETDGPEANEKAGTRCRVLIWDDPDQPDQPPAQFIYTTDPAPRAVGESHNSLTELLALPDGRALALERSFAIPRGYNATLFLLDGSVDRPDQPDALPVLRKKRLASVRELGLPVLGNIEGMALGPELTDLDPDAERKGRLLLLIADDNFGSDAQQGTQAIAIRIDLDP